MKALGCFLLLLICGFHSLHLHPQLPQKDPQAQVPFDKAIPRIRKSIFALNSTTRKAFFWSLKALAVLPAPPTFNYWAMDNLLFFDGDNLTSAHYFTPYPRCLQDLLIAMHETSGQHMGFYFGGFHRHWLVFFEIWLCFAHDVLSGGKEKLLQHYSQDFYSRFQQKWDVVFEEYQREGMAGITEMAAHYWNPTDFADPDQISMPIEMHQPLNGRVPDHMDELMFAVREHYAWEFNVRTRLTAENYPYNKDEIVERLRKANHFNPVDYHPTPYSQDELNLMNGQLSGRGQPQPQNYQSFTSTYGIFNNGSIFGVGDFKNHSNARLEEYFNRTGERMSVYNMTQAELFTVFGGDYTMEVEGQERTIRHSYITKQQRRGLNLPHHAVSAFNKKIPHYLFAYTLFNHLNTPDYVAFYREKNGIADSHSMMHGYHGLLMQEVLNLNIFVLHGWIQLEFQMRIRRENSEDRLNGDKKNYDALKRYLKQRPLSQQPHHFSMSFIKKAPTQPMKADLQASFERDLSSFHANVTRVSGYAIDQPLLSNQTGYYPIYEWTNPILLEQVIANETNDSSPNCTMVLPVRDFMLSPTRIRSSLDLTQLYNKLYVPLSQERFGNFVNLSKHQFNFNYEIYNGPEDPLPRPLFAEDGNNIPTYLQNMRKDVEFQAYDIFDMNLNRTINSLYKTNFSLFNTHKSSIAALFEADQLGNRHMIKRTLIDHYTSYLHNVTYSYAEYPAEGVRRMHEIRLRLKEANSCGKREGEGEDVRSELASYGFTLDHILQITSKEGVLIQLLNVTNRPNCSACPRRRIYLDTDVDLLERDFPLWKAWRRLMMGREQTLALGGGIEQPSSFARCFIDNVQLFVPGEGKGEGEEGIKVRPVRGMQQITIFVQVLGLSEIEIASSRIEVLPAVSDEDGDIPYPSKIVVHNPINGTNITLPRLDRPNNGSIKNDILSYLYRGLTVRWLGGGVEMVVRYWPLHFSVRGDYRLVVDFGRVVGRKRVLRLEDVDYHFKRELFEDYREDWQ